jgi:hypothetical protein
MQQLIETMSVSKPNARHSSLLSAILSLCAFSYSFPIPEQGAGSCNALLEISPWQISDIVIVGDPHLALTGSSIQFRAKDNNHGLEFETYCRWSSPAITSPRCQETQGWHPCEDRSVRFLYQPSNLDRPNNLQIRRSYLDDWYVARETLWTES